MNFIGSSEILVIAYKYIFIMSKWKSHKSYETKKSQGT